MTEEERPCASLDELARTNRRLERKLARATANLARLEDLKEAMRSHLQTVIVKMQEAEDELVLKNQALVASRLFLEDSERRARAASAAKSAFLANMSHEFRTPLNAILGYVELLVEEASDAEAERPPRTAAEFAASLRDDLGAIRRAGHHLLELISDVLDISKIESGRLTIVREPVDLAALTLEIADQLRPLAAAKGLALEVRRPSELVAIADETKLKQILLNLVGNAIKFTERGRVGLSLSQRDERVEFAVEDTGIGMTSDQIDKVFEPFVQADDTTTRRFGGTGLGLAICREMVRLMDGTIEMSSDLGVGTRCVIVLPTREGEP